MEYVLSGNTAVIRLDRGDEITASLLDFAKKENVRGAYFTAIGASNDLEIGVFDPISKEYSAKRVEEDCEIASLIGNISNMNGKEYVHAHIVVTNKAFETIGGHLLKGVISLTCEIFVTIVEFEINRKRNEKEGINTFAFD